MRLTLPEVFALLSFAFALPHAQGESPRPRGVGPEFAKFYKSSTSFTCISNPSIVLPFASLNDDYCDCPDGSDEPGTSACAHLSHLSPLSVPGPVIDDAAGTAFNTSPALPGFYCKNKGHQPTYAPSTAVNDGVCDYGLCCDGSDEWAGVGGIKCEDRCREIGREWRKADETRQKAMSAAKRARQQLLSESQKLREEVEDRIGTLETQIEASKRMVQQMEREFAETEKEERRRIVRAPKEGGKMGVLVGLARGRMDELRTALERVKGERDRKAQRLEELEGIMATFKAEYNPNFNDEGVKRAVRAWEDHAARDKGPDGGDSGDTDVDDMIKSDAENGLVWDDYAAEDVGSDVDVLYQIENYLPPSIRDWVDTKLRDLRLFLVESGVIARKKDKDASQPESQAVSQARERLDSTKSELSNHQDELKGHEEDLKKDYGPDGIFRGLKGKCISTNSGEYEYELCWMDRTTQKSQKGGSNTVMGNYERLDLITVDEELPPNGKGVGAGERIAMRFGNGQHCWNGPVRSTLVVLACADKDEVWKVVEEEKCSYRMDVGTPAVCTGTNGNGGGAEQKDEL